MVADSGSSRACSPSAQVCSPSAQIKAAVAHVCRLKWNQRKGKLILSLWVFKIEFPAFQHWQLCEWKGMPYQISLNFVENLRKQATSARSSRHLYKSRKQNLPNFDKMYRRVINGDGLFPPCPSIKGWMSKFVPALDLYEFRLR
jgi:hypothetical protein